MSRSRLSPIAVLAPSVLCVVGFTLLARSGPPQTQADLITQLTPEQREKYNTAIQAFTAEHYAEALGFFRAVLPQLAAGSPAQVVVAKYAAESAINASDRDYALQLLKPIEAADGDDWQAASLLARVYAESGQRQLRDSELTHLIDLHRQGAASPIGGLRQIVLERIPTKKEGSILVFYSLEPWGPYNVYVLGRVFTSAGQQVLRITLESGDFDQPSFAKEHPDLAARGARRFSIDGYGADRKVPNGQTIQTHFTYGFYDGRPSYDTVRERRVEIADGRTKPISSKELLVAK